MADEVVGEAAAAVAAEGGAVVLLPNPEAELAEQGAPSPPTAPDYAGAVDAHGLRIDAIEQRIALIEADNLLLRADVEGRAPAGHEHPVDEDVRIISDELRALREEEVAPRRGRLPERGWLRRMLRGSNG